MPSGGGVNDPSTDFDILASSLVRKGLSAKTYTSSGNCDDFDFKEESSRCIRSLTFAWTAIF